MSRIRSVTRASVYGKSVLLRVDFNVPIKRGKISEDFRIKSSIPTIKWLLERGAKIFIISHLGKPSTKNLVLGKPSTKNLVLGKPSTKNLVLGKPARKDPEFSLRPVAERLSKILGRRVIFFEELTPDLGVFWKTPMVPAGTIAMLENLRFWSGEEKNDVRFARLLAGLGDVYINDAFAVSHRSNASVAAVTKFLPSYAGILLLREIKMLDAVKHNRKQPVVAVFGGKKLSDKLPLIKAFLPRANAVLTGGGVANTFLLALGNKVGKSVVEKKLIAEATQMFKTSNSIFLPQDWRSARNPQARTGIRTGNHDVAKNEAIYDIGPKTEKLYAAILKRARMILWNGPMGLFENPRFGYGSRVIARAIAKNRRAVSVIGGGETIACFRQAMTNSQLPITKTNVFLSTGGGAMLEYLAGKKLPGIEALKR